MNGKDEAQDMSELHMTRLEAALGLQMRHIRNLEERMFEKEKENMKQAEDFKRLMLGLTKAVYSQSEPGRPSDGMYKIDCPVCLDSVRPPMRLKQCGQVIVEFVV